MKTIILRFLSINYNSLYILKKKINKPKKRKIVLIKINIKNQYGPRSLFRLWSNNWAVKKLVQYQTRLPSKIGFSIKTRKLRPWKTVGP